MHPSRRSHPSSQLPRALRAGAVLLLATCLVIALWPHAALSASPTAAPLAAAPQVTESNVALGKPVAASVPSRSADLSIITDGNTDTNPFVSLDVGLQWIEIDLQQLHRISRVRVYHYWGDGRIYHDVIVRLSDDGANYAAVYNNDVDGSAGFGIGADTPYTETYAGMEIALSVPRVARYVRLYSNGSSLNGYNHYVEVKVFGVPVTPTPTATPSPTWTPSPTRTPTLTPSPTATSTPTPVGATTGNVALGKPVRASLPSRSAALSIATDGNADTNPFISLDIGQQWLEVDLQGSYDLTRLRFYHYWGDGRTYRDVIARLSADGVAYTTVFNNDADGSGGFGPGADAPYPETYAGKEVVLPVPICARYVRLYSNGSSLNGYNHYVEAQAFGAPAATACSPAPPPPPPPAGKSVTIRPDREFASTSYVHQPLADNAELDPNSAAMVANLRGQISRYYGVASVNIREYTPPIFVVPADQPTVRVKAWDRNDPNWSFQPLQEKWQAVPLPDDFTASPGTDQEAVVYQPSTGKVWEFWLMQKTGGKTTDSWGRQVDEWGARWGGRIDNIATNGGMCPTEGGGNWNTTSGIKYCTTATRIPFLAGILTIEEQQNGVIDHVVGLAIPEALAYPRWSYPASFTDGQSTGANAIPEGAIFRLPADLDLDALDMDPYARMIARAVQRHGMVIWDRAGAVSFRAENPGNRYPEGSPYTKVDGILRCPNGVSQPSCWADSNGRLRGFPWDRLQVLKLLMNQ